MMVGLLLLMEIIIKRPGNLNLTGVPMILGKVISKAFYY